MGKKKHSENYLDYVPAVNPIHTWGEKGGIVTVHMVHRGFYAGIAQKFFHTPRVSLIDLDKYGSFLWRQMDGTTNVGQLAEAMRNQFGSEAEPLYDRLVQYLRILHNNQLIVYRGKDRGAP